MSQSLHNLAICACLPAVLPILFARCWRARVAAMLFGALSLGLGLYLFLSNTTGSDSSDDVRRLGMLALGALVLAYVSLVVTFRLDRKREAKS
jgi:peptidoglycan/LPS O-acetylase OafA/YrhL